MERYCIGYIENSTIQYTVSFLCCIFKNDCCITYIFMEVLNFLNVQDGGYEH